MSWQQVAAPHVGHRTTLKSLYELRCVDCAMTLVIHREGPAAAPQPPSWRRPDRTDLRPMPEGFKDRVLRTIAEQRKAGERS